MYLRIALPDLRSKTFRTDPKQREGGAKFTGAVLLDPAPRFLCNAGKYEGWAFHGQGAPG